MWLEQLPVIAWELWSSFTTKQFIEYTVILVGGAYTIYLRWRFSQRNLGKRVFEFIQQEDKRLNRARLPIIARVRRPEAERFAYEPIYSNPELAEALRQIGLGSPKKAQRLLERASKKVKERLEVTENNLKVQMEQLATAHLALGSIAASRSEHALALSEFQKAEKLYRDDPEFLEHVGLQLVKVGNAGEALRYFERMREKAKEIGDQRTIAWSYRHEAYAYWNLPKRGTLRARRALRKALDEFPNSAPPFEIATTWELLGKLQRERGFHQAAIKSYTHALVIYSGQQRHEEGRKALMRVESIIQDINKELANGADNNSEDEDV